MKRLLIICIACIFFFVAESPISFAAFAMPPKTNEATAIATAHRPDNRQQFTERRVPHLLSQLQHAVTGEQEKRDTHLHSHKTGWQGIVSFVCAILGLLTGSLPVALLLGVSALVFGIMGLNRAYHSNTGLAVTGVVIGCIEILVAVMLLAVMASTLV